MSDPRPITREEFDAFVERYGQPARLPREPYIIVHPKDLPAVKQLFNLK